MYMVVFVTELVFIVFCVMYIVVCVTELVYIVFCVPDVVCTVLCGNEIVSNVFC